MKALLITTVLAVAATTAQAQAIGERLAKSACTQCHSFGAGEPAGVGPNLHGLIGRPAGSVEGFAYSAAFLKALKGQPWTARCSTAGSPTRKPSRPAAA